MIFEQIATGGCQSYLIGCDETCAGALIDPELEPGRPLPRRWPPRDGLRIRYVDRHAHPRRPLLGARASSAEQLGALIVMHRVSPAPFVDVRVDDGESIVVGKLRLQVLHTPGHTARLDVPGRSRIASSPATRC